MFHPPVSRTVVLSFQSASTFAPYTEAEVTAVLTNMLHSALTRYDEAATIHITEVKLPSRRKSGYVTFVKVHH